MGKMSKMSRKIRDRGERSFTICTFFISNLKTEFTQTLLVRC